MWHGHIPSFLGSWGVRGLSEWAGIGNTAAVLSNQWNLAENNFIFKFKHLNYLDILEILFETILVCLRYSSPFLPFKRIFCSCNNNSNTLIIKHSPAAVYHNNRITMHLLTHFLKTRPKHFHFSMSSERRPVIPL